MPPGSAEAGSPGPSGVACLLCFGLVGDRGLETRELRRDGFLRLRQGDVPAEPPHVRPSLLSGCGAGVEAGRSGGEIVERHGVWKG